MLRPRFIAVCVLLAMVLSSCGTGKPTPPPREPDLTVMYVTSPTSSVGLVFEHPQGEKLAVLGIKNASGQITNATGAVYSTPGNRTCTFWLGSTGLPEYVVSDNWLFRFYNYTSGTVDIIGIDSLGAWNHWLQIPIDSAALSMALPPTRLNPVNATVFASDSTRLARSGAVTAANGWPDLFNTWRRRLDLIMCAIGVVSMIGAPVTGPFIAHTAAMACASVLLELILNAETMTIVEYVCPDTDAPGPCQPAGVISLSLAQDTETRDIRRATADFLGRITLTWGERPEDMDSHVWTPSINGTSHHIYWRNKGSEHSIPFAALDVDDVTSYGPENITFKKFFPGTYYYSVHHYEGSGTVTTSNATVRILGSDGSVRHSWSVPAGSAGPNWWWNVFSFDGTLDRITLINQISATPLRPVAAASSTGKPADTLGLPSR